MATMMSQHIPPRDLSITPKVIGAGYSRTGTVSFSLALEQLLGGPVLHSGTACLVREEAFIKKWVKIMNSTSDAEIKAGLRDLTAGYVAITDAPAALFTRELAELYPHALVICTTRNHASWWKSFDALAKTMLLTGLNLVLQVLPTLRYFGRWIAGLTRRHNVLYNHGDYYPLAADHLAHHERYVRRSVKEEEEERGKGKRLFFYDVKEGWEPLCEMLGREVPDVAFPHANDQDAVQDFMMGFVKQAINRWLLVFGVLGASILALIWGRR